MNRKNQTCIIFDGNHLVHRVWNTASGKNLKTRVGQSTGILHGFLSSYCLALRNFKPDRVVVVWDRKSRHRQRILENYRKRLEKEAVKSASAATILANTPKRYKASRYVRKDSEHTEFQDIVLPQMQSLQWIIPLLGATQLIVDEVEGDDLIGIASEILADIGDVTIISSDHDLYQLINDRVSLYDPIRKTFFKKDDFITKYGMEPDRFPEVKALCGDEHDDIPGVPRVGEKTAVKLLKTIEGNINDLIEKAKNSPSSPIMRTLPDYEDQVHLAYSLSFIMSSTDELDDEQREQFDKCWNTKTKIDWDELRSFTEIHELKKVWQDLKILLARDDDLLANVKTLDDIFNLWGDCKRCKLHETRTHIVYFDGAKKAPIMAIGEGPGASEDFYGKPFVGRAGKFLDEHCLAAVGLERKDIHICNIVMCRPTDENGDNRPPDKDEVESCFPRLAAQIKLVNPKIIAMVGDKAFKCFFPNSGQISQSRGTILTHPDFPNIRFVPVFHPSYLMRLNRPDHSDRKKSQNDWLHIKLELDSL